MQTIRDFAASISVLRICAGMLVALILGALPSQAATDPGTLISNTAQVRFMQAGSGIIQSVNSNTLSAIVAPAPSASTLRVLRFTDAASATQTSTAGPTQCRNGGIFTNLPQPVFANGTSVDAAQMLALAGTETVHAGDAMFLQVSDADQNRSATVFDTIDLVITSAVGDTETIRLRETGANTGVFVGYIQTRSSAANSGDCVLQVDRDSQITALYTDAYNSADTSNVSVLVDPYGLIFDSLTGQPVNGARVRLINATTGLPASVFGDNGISTYPAEMTTGNAVTDSGGAVYNLPDGVFRFPLVALGQYRLEVTTPSGYTYTSGRSIAELNQLGGAPYRLSSASFGAAFAVNTPVVVAVDIPVDPSGTQLYVTKTTTTTSAAVGDFVQYVLGVQNPSSSIAVNNVTVTDMLPMGLRYQQGSARVNGSRVADPVVSSDGRNLQFAVGTLSASARLKLSYVVEVTAAAREQQLTNRAMAGNTAGASSNVAQATIHLRNELFTDTAFIAGRIVEGSCDLDGIGLKGVPGVRVYLEDGRYAVTDEQGKYHFDGVPAGSHVVQLDTVTVPETLEPQTCDQGVRFAGRGYSQFVDLRAGSLWRADFKLRAKAPPVGRVQFGMTTRIVGDADLAHTLNVQVEALSVVNAKAMVMLPEGLEYVSGSATLSDNTIADPQQTDGTLIFRLNDLAAGTQSSLGFRTRLKPDASGGFIMKSLLMFDTPAQKSQRSEPVENRFARGDMNYESASYRFSPHFAAMSTALSAADRQQLDRLAAQWRGVNGLRIKVVGHSDNQAIPDSGQHLFADNYALSQARAASVANFLRDSMGLSATQFDIEGKGADEPIATGEDAASLAQNRRVEISIDGVRVKEPGKVSVITARAAAPVIDTTGSVAGKPVLSAKPVVHSAPATDLDVESLSGGIAMLRPVAGEVPAIPSIKIAIQHAATQNVELRLNDTPVSALNFDGTQTKGDNTLSLSRWRGVDLKDGANKLVAIVRDVDGNEVARIERLINYSGGAVRAELVKDQSRLTADGNSNPVIALRMFDAAGEPARPGTMGTFRVEAPYRSWWEVQQLQDQQLASLAPRDPQFVVDEDGLARIELAPSADSGMAVINLHFNERQTQDLRVWLEPQARDWVLVGLAEGTAAYNTISGNAEAATGGDSDAEGVEGYEQDGRVAFFAKGRIRGEFLLTLAYDSAREGNKDKQSLLGVIDPNKYYTLYGDGSEQRFEAASQRKLYIKLERRQFMAMFGDFNTGITMTERGRYSRTLNGLKSEYAGERFGFTAFAANTDQGYVQDELQGDGTSGLYQLTQQNIIANSDKLRIEVRDRFDTGTVLSTTTLTRYIDYDIDYLNGTLYFKQPVMSRDGGFNPQFIIVDYEVNSAMNASVSAGGRVYSNIGSAQVGVGFINEGAQNGDTRLASLDTRIMLREGTQLRAEVARSESDNPARAAQADAFFAELKHVSRHLDASAYFRMQDDGFGFGQQLSTETGSRKAGMDARARINDTWSMRGEAQYQQLTATDATRELVAIQAQRETQLTTVGAGLRHVADSNVSIGNASSQQGFVTGSVKLLDQRLTLRAEQDVSLSGSSAVTDYPDRSLLGADYLLTRDVTLFADYEHANGASLDADMTRIGLRANPWARAQLTSSMNQQFSENGTRTFASLGLTQGWQINDRWAMDFGMDQSRTVRGADSYDFNSNTTLASGTAGSSLGTPNVTKWQTGDFLALSVASLYRSELWSVTERFEHRNGSTEDRWSFTSGFYREAIRGHAFAFVTQYLNNRSQTSGDALTAAMQLSWAYRPIDSRFIVLDRIDLKHQRSVSLTQAVQSSRLVNNTHVNWQINNRTQMGFQLGARYVLSSFDGEEYSGSTGLIGADYRRDLTRIFDVGVHGTLLESFRSGVGRASLGADIGVTFMTNAWVSVGYNVQGYNDRDFDDAHYLSQGPYLRFRIKFDQDTFKDLNLAGMRAH